MQNIYYNQCSSVRVENSETETVNMNNGVARGYVLSLGYFNLYSENTFRCIVMQEASDALSKTADSDTVSTYQVSSVQLVTDKKLEAFNKA